MIMYVVLLTGATFSIGHFLSCVNFMLFLCSVTWLFLFGCQYQCKWLTGNTRLQTEWPIMC